MSKHSWLIVFLLFPFFSVLEAFAQEAKPFKPHPLAPSLPLLSDEEYAKIEKIIEQFILYDSGQLPGADGKKILADFNALGPESIPLLVEGLNRAGNLQASCPAVIIARKLRKMLIRTKDTKLLDYVRETAGLGVTAKRHLGAIHDLKVACITRKGYLQRIGAANKAPAKTAAAAMSDAELIQATAKATGLQLKQALVELEKRDGEKVALALADAMARPQKDIQLFTQNLLLKHLYRQPPAKLKSYLKHERESLRLRALYMVGFKKLPWGDEVISLLDDESIQVRQLARRVLIQMSGGRDFGPSPDGSASERRHAIQDWQAWWKSQSN